MALHGEDIRDLAAVMDPTYLDRGRITDVAAEFRNFFFFDYLLQEEKVAVRGGETFTWPALVDYGTDAQWVGLNEEDNVTQVDKVQTLSLNFKHGTKPLMWERRQFLMNRGEQAILNLIDTEKYAAWMTIVHLMERTFPKQPPSGDTLQPYGLMYWLQWNATEGFHGGNPVNFAAGQGGLSRTTYTGLKNHTRTYASIDSADMVQEWRVARRYIDWRSPVRAPLPGIAVQRPPRYRVVAPLSVVIELEKIGRSQNENLGAELDMYADEMRLAKNPIFASEVLDELYPKSLPSFILDMESWRVVFLEGDVFETTEPMRAPWQHNTYVIWVDWSCNFLCQNPRRNAIIAKSDPVDEL